MRRTGWIAHCVLWPSAETGHKPTKYARMSGLRLPKCAAERTHRGKMRTEKKAAFAMEGGRRSGYACRRTRRSERIAARYGRKRKLPSQAEGGHRSDCDCRRARRSERIAARCGRKRKPPSQRKADAGRTVIAEERGGLDASRQDTEGKENRLRDGRRTPVGLRLPKCVADWTYRGKIRAEKKTTFAVEGGCRRGYDCRRTRRSERIAARYGWKRKPPSRWKADAGRAVIAEERGEEVLPASCGSCPVGIFAFIRCGRRQRSRSRAPVRVPRSRRTAWPRIPDSHAKSVRPRRDGTWRIPSSTFKTPLRKDFAGADGPEDFPGVCIESMLREGVFYAPWKFLTFAPPSAGAI